MVAEYVWPDRVTEERQQLVAAIVWILHEQGPIQSEEGRASAILMDHLKEAGFDISSGWLTKTLVDLEKRGLFGHFIERTINGKRTFAITGLRDPKRDPFPPNPFIEADTEDDEIEEVEEVEEAVITDLVDVPGVALELIDQPSLADKILYIVSLLNEILTDQLTMPEREFEAKLDARLTAVNAVLEENARLRSENESLREDKRKLAAALEHANTMMRDRAARVTNGQREPVPA